MKIILETSRLILRELNPNDAQYFYDLNLEPDVIQYTGDPPFESVESAKSFLENYAQYKLYGYGRWACILKENNEWIGWCGLKFEKEHGDTDIGYRFFKKYWGKGYATESAKACLEYGFQKLGLKRIIGRAMNANGASIRIFEKLKMQYVKDINFDGQAAVEYEVSSKFKVQSSKSFK